MHIISRVNRGGTARWLDVLIEGQLAEGHEVVLAAGHVETDEVEDLLFERYKGIRVPGLERAITFAGDLRAFLFIRRLLKRERPDVLNTHASKAGALGRLAALSLGKARPGIVHTIHGHLLYGYFGKFGLWVYRITEQLLSRQSEVVLVSGKQVILELERSGVLQAGKGVLICPGVKMDAPAMREGLRDQYGLHGELVIGWLGRMSEIKRPDRVVEIAKAIPEIEFLMGGDGALLEAIKIIAPANLKFTGWTNPNEFWPACDIALITSDNEAQPLSIVEASFAGIPTVALDVGAVSEVVIQGESGFIGKNTLELISALRVLSLNSEKRIRMGKFASKYASEMFNADQFLRSHEAAYSAALNSRVK